MCVSHFVSLFLDQVRHYIFDTHVEVRNITHLVLLIPCNVEAKVETQFSSIQSMDEESGQDLKESPLEQKIHKIGGIKIIHISTFCS